MRQEPGKESLCRLLAEMGLPLHECKNKFSHMSPEAQRKMGAGLAHYAPAYGLNDLRFWSFSKSLGYKLRFSSSDVVYAVTALLEQAHTPPASFAAFAPVPPPAVALCDSSQLCGANAWAAWRWAAS